MSTMRRVAPPQRKLIQVNKKLGNRGIKKQQGTTRILYDSLPLDGATEFRFFEGANNRAFPRTNMGATGNQLTVGETFAFERAYFATITEDPVLFTWVVAAVTIIAFPNILMGELNLEVANQQVIKPIPVMSFADGFNKSADFIGDVSFDFDTNLVLPPLIEFVSTLRVPIQPAVADTDLRLTFEGVGAILAPRVTL